jgi:hypothetical protein
MDSGKNPGGICLDQVIIAETKVDGMTARSLLSHIHE